MVLYCSVPVSASFHQWSARRPVMYCSQIQDHTKCCCLTISLFALEAEHFASSECHYLLSKLIGSTQVVVIPWRSLSSCLNSKDRNLMNRHCSSFRWPSHTPVPWNHAIHKIARVDTVSTIPSRSDAIVEAWCTTVVCQWWILYGAVSSRMLVQNRPRQVTLRYDWCKIIN